MSRCSMFIGKVHDTFDLQNRGLVVVTNITYELMRKNLK